jgi:hypothetical protein
VHGNETGVLEAFEQLKGENPSVSFFIANKVAMKLGRRYVDSDLNRVFPGKEDGDHEERLAYSLSRELLRYDHVIDLHTTTAETDDFIITVDEENAVADAVPLARHVVMGPRIAHGKALIDHVRCGASVEFSERASTERIHRVLQIALENLSKGRKVSKTTYLAYGVETRDIADIRNFKEHEEGFIPILAGEEAYPFTCMKARLLS